MKVIAFTFTTSAIYVCALSGTKDEPELVFKHKLSIPVYSTPETVEWFETEFKLIINREKPNLATYRLTMTNVNHNYIGKVYYAQAILNLICAKDNIVVEHTSPTSVVASKFGLPKNADLQAYIDSQLNSPGNPWDVKMKDTALMALNRLP
jgi:hypothetical protein